MMDTATMRKAEKWLRERGGHGLIDRYGRVVAAGEVAKEFDASTWLRLVAHARLTGNDGRIMLESAAHSPMKCAICGRFGARYVTDPAWPHDEIEMCERCLPPPAPSSEVR